MPRRSRRRSMESDSSSASSPERGMDDDNESFINLPNDSQSSLSVSLQDMDLDNIDYERQRRLSPITRLPAELLIAVFSRLSTPSDLLNCMLVCKAWARNSVDLLWHRPVTTRWKSLLNVIQTARKKDGFFAYHDLIKRLNLGQLRNEVSDGTLQPLSVCKRIERLTLPGCAQLTDLSLVPVVEGNRSLMAIDLSDLEMITDRSMFAIAKNCYRLQGLNISNCKGITDESLVEVAKNCRRLKRLKLNDCAQLTDYSVTAFADNCNDMLEIDLYKCANITDMSVTALIKGGRQLRELRLAQCTGITDDAFLHLPSEHRFDALRILDLTDCNELQDGALQKIVQAAPRLRNLVLAKCRNITDRGVMAITKLGKNLHFLHLGHCSLISDYGVQALIKYCNRIRYIDFSCCANLTDESVSMLANLPKLKRIGLVKCANITDFSLRALARPKPYDGRTYTINNLERLHLSYCTNLSVRGIRNLLINCPQLTHLSLTGVQPFLRDDLLQFCRDAPNEFNEHQRDVFCVFSGAGVYDLRRWLQEHYPTPPSSDAGSSEDGLYNGLVRHPGMASSAPARGFFPPGTNANAALSYVFYPNTHVPGHIPLALPQALPMAPAHAAPHPHGGLDIPGAANAPPRAPHTVASPRQWTPPPHQAPQRPPPQPENSHPRSQSQPQGQAQAHSAPGPASYMGQHSAVDQQTNAFQQSPHGNVPPPPPPPPPPMNEESSLNLAEESGDEDAAMMSQEQEALDRLQRTPNAQGTWSRYEHEDHFHFEHHFNHP